MIFFFFQLHTDFADFYSSFEFLWLTDISEALETSKPGIVPSHVCPLCNCGVAPVKFDD